MHPSSTLAHRRSHLLLLTLYAIVACSVEDTANEPPNAQEFRAGPALPASMASTNASLQATATAGHGWTPGRLLEVANDYAARYEGLPHDVTPLGITYLKDADGNLTAMSVTYALVDDLTRPTAQGLQNWINAESAAIATALAGDDEMPLQRIAGLRVPDEYLNVVVGATPRQPRLLTMSRGLPVQVYEQLGRRRIAAELGVPLGSVSAGTVFYDSTVDRASRVGLRYQVTGKPAQLFFAPNEGAPLGIVMPAATFMPFRTEAIAEYEQALEASLRTSTSTPLPTLLENKHARQWGRTFALMDAMAGAMREFPCTNCSQLSATLYEAGVGDLHAQIFDDGDDHCDCVETLSNGSTRPVNDCDAIECCDLVDGEFPEGEVCLVDCECDCEAELISVFHYDHLIRGVPNLFQHDVPVTPPAFLCAARGAVGCGPIAAAEIMIWYDMVGHDALLDDHRNTGGRYLWQDLAEELRDDFLDSHCWLDMTWTLQADLATGMFNFFADHGVSAAVWHDVVEINDEAFAWNEIEDEIEANRPLILGYNATNGGPLGQGWFNHYAVIAGHSTTVGTKEVYLSKGGGWGSNEIIEWDLVGQVHLYSIEVGDTPTGNEECMADTPFSDLFVEDPNSLGYTASEEPYHDYPVKEHLMGTGDPDCDRIGGLALGWFDSHWTEGANCLTPTDVRVLEQSYTDFSEELAEGDIVEWVWE